LTTEQNGPIRLNFLRLASLARIESSIGEVDMKFLLGLVVSFAAWLTVMWRFGKYAQMIYALYLSVLGVMVGRIAISALYHFAGRHMVRPQS
jgi:hypothetical protein